MIIRGHTCVYCAVKCANELRVLISNNNTVCHRGSFNKLLPKELSRNYPGKGSAQDDLSGVLSLEVID